MHNMAIHLPGLVGGLHERYALVFEPAGAILDHTQNIIPIGQVPGDWLSSLNRDEPLFLNSEHLAPKLLRLVIIPMELNGRHAFVGVGVAHAE